MSTRFRATWSEICHVLLPVACAGCNAPGRALCAACEGAFLGPPVERVVQGLRVHSAASWGDPTARVMRALKQHGSRALARPLGQALRGAVTAVQPDHGVVALVAIPSTREAFRRRGFRPVDLLLRGGGMPAVPVLRSVHRVADQRRLGREDRADNMVNAFRCVRAIPRAVTGVILIDDVITTGSTMHSAHMALRDAGVAVLGGATVLSTPLRISHENDR